MKFFSHLTPCCFPIWGHRLTPTWDRDRFLGPADKNSAKILHVTLVYFPHLLFQHIPFLPVHFTSSNSGVSSTLLRCASRVHLLCIFLLPTSFMFLAGPGPLQEIAVSAFSRCPSGLANTSLLRLLLTLLYISLLTSVPLLSYFFY